MTLANRKSVFWPVIRVSSGNFLEMYDFMVFGYYAAAIGKAFFPTGNAFPSLMLSLMTFGAGFLMRPLGAIMLGAYTDRHGRRAGLLVTLSLMSLGIISIALTPGYARIGLIAPVLVLCGRLLQGFSAGMELGGVSVYLSEIATPGHKRFLCQLAIRQSTGRCDVRCAGWCAVEQWVIAGGNAELGMARAASDRLRDHSVFVLVKALLARNR